jgi:hypothetical protein
VNLFSQADPIPGIGGKLSPHEDRVTGVLLGLFPGLFGGIASNAAPYISRTIGSRNRRICAMQKSRLVFETNRLFQRRTVE